MTFIANIDIGEYKKGDVVPEEQAAIWNSMYSIQPCDEVVREPEETQVEMLKPSPMPLPRASGRKR